jgi:hypothetical protein
MILLSANADMLPIITDSPAESPCDHVGYDDSLVRSSDIMCSLGDPTKATQVLDWRPTLKFHHSVDLCSS